MRGGLVLAYHDIGSEKAATTDYYVSPERLRAHLAQARRSGMEFVSLSTLTAAVTEGRCVDGMLAVSFDDALAGVHHHALPCLLELNVPATVFVVTSELGVTPPWWDGSGRTMTRAELAEVASVGLELAAHTRHHPSLLGLPLAQLHDEVGGSRREIEDLTSRPVDLFAYPFGHHDAAARAEVTQAGFTAAYTFTNGRIMPGMNPLRLPRLTMSARQNRARFAYQLARPPSSWPPESDET